MTNGKSLQYMRRCETCGHYNDPKQILEYPNTDNNIKGWRRCKKDNTVKRDTVACHKHTDGEGTDYYDDNEMVPIEKRSLVESTPVTKRSLVSNTTPKPKRKLII